ncbi:MAG: dephospho-CoA kinase [Erysipelotrichaceae bacterium]|nr:dephospho-CoA kinase [Erysipelotrichaceae bacterium]MDP3305454.1 dephospho-CoA kinase [Erysipelotrichaceae bacterium]
MSTVSKANRGLKIAITGSMGSGKSAVCAMIKKAGWPLISADEIVADLYDFDTFVKTRLTDFYGEEVIEDHKINRKMLFSFMMKNDREKKRVESLIHPLVEKKMLEYFAKQDSDLLFAEIPLLYESHWQDKFDQVWAVVADDEIRIDRLITKRNVNKEQALVLMSHQIDQNKKMELADVVIDNNGTLSDLSNVVYQLLNRMSGGEDHVESE